MLLVKHLIDTYSLTADDITRFWTPPRRSKPVNNRAIKKQPPSCAAPHHR